MLACELSKKCSISQIQWTKRASYRDIPNEHLTLQRREGNADLYHYVKRQPAFHTEKVRQHTDLTCSPFPLSQLTSFCKDRADLCSPGRQISRQPPDLLVLLLLMTVQLPEKNVLPSLSHLTCELLKMTSRKTIM